MSEDSLNAIRVQNLLEWLELLSELQIDDYTSELVLRKLGRHVRFERGWYQQVAQTAELKYKQDTTDGWRYLIQNLPSGQDTWFEDLIEICSEHPEAWAIVEDIEEDLLNKIVAYRKHLMSDQDQLGASTSSVHSKINKNAQQQTSTESDELRAKAAEVLKSYKGVTPKGHLNIRPYQAELAEPVLAGHNTVIVAPTGTGKTIVAAYCISKHFERRRGQLSRVVMLVPSIPLVHQQQSVLSYHLSDVCLVEAIVGGESATAKLPRVLNNHITVMTPQILVNMLIHDRVLNWDDLSLLILDECHHTHGQHPYNVTMRSYAVAADAASVQLPQIIGLSASLGTDNANEMQSAKHHILKMCARLNATRLSTVQREKQNLAKFANDPFDEFISCQTCHTRQPLYTTVCDLMKDIERRIKPCLDALLTNGWLKSSRFLLRHFTRVPTEQLHMVGRHAPNVIPSNPSCLRYELWRSNVFRQLQLLNDEKLKFDLLRCMNYLKMYCNSLELLSHLPAQFARSYLEGQIQLMERCERTQVNEIDNVLVDVYNETMKKLPPDQASNTVENDLVHQLIVQLRKEFAGTSMEFENRRAIVFVRTRSMAHYLRSYLNNCDGNGTSVVNEVRAGVMTSVNQSSARFGQEKAEQQRQLDMFRSGANKILVCTSVAEEGVDIPQCTLIVTYNLIANETARQQKKGRARTADARSVLLAQTDGWLAEREIMSLRRARLMNDVLDHIHAIGENRTQQLIDGIKSQLRLERDTEQYREDDIRQRLGNKVFDIRCRQCSRFMCKSNSIRLAMNTHYVVVDAAFWMRTKLLPLKRVRVFDGCAIAASLSCEKCRHHWGSVVKVMDVFLPNIHPEGFTVYDNEADEPCEPKSQWSKITTTYFYVNAITPVDKDAMRDGLRLVIERDPEVFAQLEREIEQEEARLLSGAIENEDDTSGGGDLAVKLVDEMCANDSD